jgi:hypothetical protein
MFDPSPAIVLFVVVVVVVLLHEGVSYQPVLCSGPYLLDERMQLTTRTTVLTQLTLSSLLISICKLCSLM